LIKAETQAKRNSLREREKKNREKRLFRRRRKGEKEK